MALDITQLEGLGITKWVAEGIDYPTNPRNAFKYWIKFLGMNYSDENQSMTGSFRVIRYAQQNEEWKNDISYVFDSVASDASVDKDGNVVEEDDVARWGTEFERMQILFNAPIADSSIVIAYQAELFDKGLFDFPKA